MIKLAILSRLCNSVSLAWLSDFALSDQGVWDHVRKASFAAVTAVFTSCSVARGTFQRGRRVEGLMAHALLSLVRDLPLMVFAKAEKPSGKGALGAELELAVATMFMLIESFPSSVQR